VRNDAIHATAVDAWLSQVSKGKDSEALLRLFEGAMAALWARTATTLGEVTLGAVADRVLYDVAEQHPAFPPLKVERQLGIVRQGPGEKLVLSPADARAAIRFMLVEFLSVLGGMTAELLTPELHEELAGVASGGSSPERKGGKRS
jgi:hypothetical protein